MTQKIFFILGFIFVLCLSAQAADTPVKKHYTGLAMHGEPKYDSTATHLDYVNLNAPKGGTLKMAAIGTFSTLNPYSIKGVAAEGLAYGYDRLMARVWDEPFTLYPLIAERAEIAPDRSGVIFHLNPKARFHDGSPITAEDVMYSYETLKSFGRPNMRRVYKLVKTAKIIDPLTIGFKFGKGYDRETVMIVAMMPVLSKAWWKSRTFDNTVLNSPLLNGPYRIAELSPGRRIVYERVPDYWAKDLPVNAGQYNFDRIVYEYFRDDMIALTAFKKGDLDLRREEDVTKWMSSYNDVDGTKISRAGIPHQRTERAYAMVFNMRRKPFNGHNIRKALSLAFDDEWVVKNLFQGQFKRTDSYFPNSLLSGAGAVLPETFEILEPWRKDLRPAVFETSMPINNGLSFRERLQEADKLLTQSGWVVIDGKRVHAKTQQPFVFEILVATPQDEKIALAFQKNLERLGITMKVRIMDTANFQERRSTYDYDMMVYFWQNTLSPGSEQMQYWTCEAATLEARWNFAGICNPALDHFAEAIANAKTYTELTAYAQAIDRVLLAEYMAILLFYKDSDYFGLSKNVAYPPNVPLYGAVMETFWASTP